MSKRILVVVALFFSIGFSENLFAQDPEFTQFYANPLYLNPALAGSNICPRVVMNYRNQWPGLGNTYATYAASYDQQVAAIGGSVGFLATHDVAGPASLTTNNLSAIYAYQLRLGHNVAAKIAVQGTYFTKSIDWSKLTFGDMVDARSGFVYNTLETQKLSNIQGWDFSTGAVLYSKNLYGGVAVDHLNQPDQGLLTVSRLPMKYTLHGGATIPFGDKNNQTSISPNIMFQKQQDFTQLDIGLYLKKSAVVAGMWLRNRDAVSVLLGIQLKHYRIGYSYDVTVSHLTNATYGSHEISLALLFPCKPRVKKYSPVNCPSF